MKIKRSDKSGGVAIELSARESRIPTPEFASLPIFRLKKILVPVDFSDCSKKALVYASALARQFGAELTLLYIVQTYPVVLEMVPREMTSTETGHQELQKLRLTVEKGINCQTEIRSGTPHVEIVHAAKDLNADLIIISTHGHSGLTHVVLGSTTERVVRQAPCPVLVVREKEHEFVR